MLPEARYSFPPLLLKPALRNIRKKHYSLSHIVQYFFFTFIKTGNSCKKLSFFVAHPSYLILQTIKRRKANWIGHILHRNCLSIHVIEGKIKGRIEVMGRRGRRRKQLLDGLKETVNTGN
jgi:hypothetical protein